jgi:hypothetical protein
MEQVRVTNIQTQRERLLKKRQSLLEAFGKAVQSSKGKRISELYIKLRDTNEFLKTLDGIPAEPEPEASSTQRRYTVSSLFLHESFKKLTADQDEQFFFITGSEINGVMVLDQWAEFAHQNRSMLGVTADTRSTHGLLIKLERFGHRLLAHFHSHPGNGADATHPSGTDEKFQQRLESAGHCAVMAIFSRDGFVRFVRLDHNLEIQIYGNGVEPHAPGIYRLTNIDPS